MAAYTNANDPNDPIGGAHALYLDYCEAADEWREDDFAELWCEDGVTRPGTGTMAPLKKHEIADWLRKGHEPFSGGQHLISHIRVYPAEADGTPISGYFYSTHQYKKDGSLAEVWGRYLTRMRFERGRWRIADHTVEVACQRPMGSLMTGKFKPMRKDDGTR